MRPRTLEFEKHVGPGVIAKARKRLARGFDLLTVVYWTLNAMAACMAILAFAAFVVMIISLIPLEWR